MGILAAAVFVVRSTYYTTKGTIPVQIVFYRYMIVPIAHVAYWRYILQRKQTQIDNYIIRENANIIDHDYIVVDKLMTKNKSVYK